MQPTLDDTTRKVEPASNLGVSIVIPIGPGDPSWRGLLVDLAAAPFIKDVVLTATTPHPDDFDAYYDQSPRPLNWVESAPGRARQMNAGALVAQGEFLWFLHADSRLGQGVTQSLMDNLSTRPGCLHYLRLAFQQDGPAMMRLNTWGANVRSRLLGMPFGDQGFCLRRDLFERLGGFDEHAEYGEDHLFVWAARRHGIKLRQVDATLSTSARKYQSGGWLRVTLRHAWLTWRQALPQAMLLLAGRKP